MLYNSISELVSSDYEAKQYFKKLPQDVQKTLMRYGGGINSLEELKHFSGIVNEMR